MEEVKALGVTLNYLVLIWVTKNNCVFEGKIVNA